MAKWHKSGIPSGFVKFESIYAPILRYILENGKARLQDIVEDLHYEPRRVSTALRLLWQHHFIFRYGKAAKWDTGDKTQWVYGLKPHKGPVNYTRKTDAERTARYEAQRKRGAYSSVFSIGRHDFNIKITEGEDNDGIRQDREVQRPADVVRGLDWQAPSSHSAR